MAGTSRYPGKEPGLCNHPCQGWGPACPASPFSQARDSPHHGHGLGRPSKKPIFAFSSVNPWAEECRVTTCVAPRGGSCVRRDAGTSPFSRAIYFLNICGRKREPGGNMGPRMGREGWQTERWPGSVGEGGRPAPPNRPTCPPATLPGPSSAPTSCRSPSGSERCHGSPLLYLASSPGLAICLDTAGHAGANRCLHKKPLQVEWARSHREQGFSSFQ